MLHEALITEFASRREHFFRSHDEYRLLWKERHALSQIPGFEDFIPDYSDAFLGPYGVLVDLCEVLTGVQSITSVKKKLRAAQDWWDSHESQQFLATLLPAVGAKTTNRACRLLIVAHNRNLVASDYSWEREILGATFDLHPDLQRRIWTTTNDAIKRSQSLDAPIWHCGARLIKHRPAWKELPKRKRFGFITEVLEEEQPLRLFSLGA